MATKVKFYTDTHIDKAVTVQLRKKGVDIIRCEEIGLATADDSEHLSYATENGRVVITHDQDFLRLNDRWQEEGKQHGGIIFVSRHLQGNRHVGTIIKTVQEYYELVEAGAGSVENDFQNQVIFIS